MDDGDVGRTVAARVALAAAGVFAAAAGAGLGWIVCYPYRDITEAYVAVLTGLAVIVAVVAFGLYRHYRR